jgi:hypothetical protein
MASGGGDAERRGGDDAEVKLVVREVNDEE